MLKKKILLWIDYSFLHFGIANYFSKLNYDLFGIVDSEESINNFLQNQKIVSFSKLWYLYENLSPSQPDMEYLKIIEEKYQINLWSIIYTDRYFYNKFNPFYKFEYNEILSLIEQECKLFEKILSESEPDFILTNTITHHYQYLFYKICKSKGIPLLTLEPLRFANKWMITNGPMYDDLDISNFNKSKSVQLSNNDINKLSTSSGKIYLKNKLIKTEISKSKKFSAIFNFIFNKKNIESTKRFSSYGRTRKNIILKGSASLFKIKRKYRESFINKNCSKTIPDYPFVYFPLHLEPERVLLMGAPYIIDQISIITSIAKSLPIGLKLIVKEHPNMNTQGWRTNSYYKQIIDLPNVELLHPTIPSENLIEKCNLVITIRGTSSLEAIKFGKPSIVFKADIGYSLLPSVHILQNIEELPTAIIKSLKKNTNSLELNKYLEFSEVNAFEADLGYYSQNIANIFNYSIGYMNKKSVTDSEIESFLVDHQNLFEKLGKFFDTRIHDYSNNN